jgi:uncharacterized lipoprotein YajG
MSAKGKGRFKTWLFFLAATVLLAGCSVGIHQCVAWVVQEPANKL